MEDLQTLYDHLCQDKSLFPSSIPCKTTGPRTPVLYDSKCGPLFLNNKQQIFQSLINLKCQKYLIEWDYSQSLGVIKKHCQHKNRLHLHLDNKNVSSFKLMIMVLTGNPTAILRSEIVLTPALRLTFPLKVNLLYVRVPEAEPNHQSKTVYHHPNTGNKALNNPVAFAMGRKPVSCPFTNTCRACPLDCTLSVGRSPPCKNESDELMFTLETSFCLKHVNNVLIETY